MKRVVSTLLLLGCVLCISAQPKEKLTPEEVIKRHLQSIGSPELLSAFRSRSAEGVVQYLIHTAGAGKLNGNAYLISDGSRVRFSLDFAQGGAYVGENFLYDGQHIQVLNSPRSAFGDFVYNQSQIMEEGLLGGILSSAWPLLKLDAHQAKVNYDGLKKIDGRELHQLSYKARKGGGGSVYLYFDPETFRHVMSLYTAEISAPMGINEVASARQQTVRYRLEERFSNFQQVNNMTLPGTWNIHFTVDGYDSAVLEWQIKLRHADDNVAVDPKNFVVGK